MLSGEGARVLGYRIDLKSFAIVVAGIVLLESTRIACCGGDVDDGHARGLVYLLDCSSAIRSMNGPEEIVGMILRASGSLAGLAEVRVDSLPGAVCLLTEL